MLKKKITIFLFLFLSSCGYKAMHSIDNIVDYNFSISKLTFVGTRDINIKIKTKLNNYTLIKSDKSFILEISSSDEKITIAKDAAGDATSFKSIIKINSALKKKTKVWCETYNNIKITAEIKTKKSYYSFTIFETPF